MKKIKIKFEIFKTLLVADELSESNRIIKFIGITFILLSLLYVSNIITVSPVILICISLSGIFFIIGDIFEHHCKSYHQKKAIDIATRYKRIGILKLYKLIFQFLSIASLIIAPYVIVDITGIPLTKISNTLTIIAIGLTVFKVGLDNSMKKAEFEEMLADELLEIASTIEKNDRG